MSMISFLNDNFKEMKQKSKEQSILLKQKGKILPSIEAHIVDKNAVYVIKRLEEQELV